MPSWAASAEEHTWHAWSDIERTRAILILHMMQAFPVIVIGDFATVEELITWPENPNCAAHNVAKLLSILDAVLF